MKKKIFYSIVATIIGLILLPMSIGVGATEVYGILSGSSFSSFISYIVFHNAKDEKTALYVEKQVENGSEDYPAPEDDEFSFVLKINDSIAAGLPYSLFQDGKRIYNYEDGQTTVEDKSKLEVELKTDRYGHFTLKAGQTAAFESLMVGDSYVVEELEQSPYIKTYPAGDTAHGTLQETGTAVTFKNLYPSGEPGTLQVRKEISYPKDYEVPETPNFTFEVKISGEKYANQEYTVKDLDTDEKLYTGTTNSDGRLALKGNTYAIFTNIPSDVDYSVEEIIDETLENSGWRLVGEALQEGATTSAGTITSFSNVLASFAVSKTMYGGISVDETFQFQVVDGIGKSFGSLPYYLYDNSLNLVDEDLHFTGSEDGSFTLTAGQRAVFVGLPQGTVYGVREISSGRYIQYLPVSSDGYMNKTVEDSVEVLPFVNAVSPSPTLLTVKKTIVNNSEEEVPPIDFVFRISKLSDDTFVPMANSRYDIVDGSGTRTFSTDENGVFTLKAWEVARFIELKKGQTYKVEEITDDLPARFTPVDAEGKQGILGDDILEMEFKNNYEEQQDAKIRIKKVNKKGEMLADATLQLIRKTKDDTTGQEVEEVLFEWKSKETSDEFQVPPGDYFIREKDAPEGYQVSEDKRITIQDIREVQEFSMVDERDTNVPTGIAFFKNHIVKILLLLIVVLGALVAVYFGVIRKKRKS